MQFHQPGAYVFVPDERPVDEALGRITHLGIGAHADDLEIMAYHGIVRHFLNPNEWFGGAIVCDGAGSVRAGRFSAYSGAQMRALRRKEQEKAAILGQYSAVAQLDYASDAARDLSNPNPEQDIQEVLQHCIPDVVYTHNPADKHDTHVAVTLRVIRAIRRLPEEKRPKRMYGCEVWRGLDWMPDRDRVGLDVGTDPLFAKKLLRTFTSQIEGKSLVEGTLGRRQGNAAFDGPREYDRFEGLTYAMDLTPLIKQPELDVAEYVGRYIDRFKEDVSARLRHT